MGWPSTVATGCLGLGVSAFWARDVTAKKADIQNRKASLKWHICTKQYTRIVPHQPHQILRGSEAQFEFNRYRKGSPSCTGTTVQVWSFPILVSTLPLMNREQLGCFANRLGRGDNLTTKSLHGKNRHPYENGHSQELHDHKRRLLLCRSQSL